VQRTMAYVWQVAARVAITARRRFGSSSWRSRAGQQPETPWAHPENWSYSNVEEDDPPVAHDAEDARCIAQMLHDEVLVEDGRSGDTPPRLIPSGLRRRMIGLAGGESKPDRPDLPPCMSPLTGVTASVRKRRVRPS
jgi:hypothetical protein